ncbi:MAG TPA: hypothetical protein VFH61_10705 [Thermoleophilia bacterium]|nr:hypothetical protein [Thermoleophilia bacterium]
MAKKRGGAVSSSGRVTPQVFHSLVAVVNRATVKVWVRGADGGAILFRPGATDQNAADCCVQMYPPALAAKLIKQKPMALEERSYDEGMQMLELCDGGMVWEDAYRKVDTEFGLDLRQETLDDERQRKFIVQRARRLGIRPEVIEKSSTAELMAAIARRDYQAPAGGPRKREAVAEAAPKTAPVPVLPAPVEDETEDESDSAEVDADAEDQLAEA